MADTTGMDGRGTAASFRSNHAFINTHTNTTMILNQVVTLNFTTKRHQAVTPAGQSIVQHTEMLSAPTRKLQ